MWTIYSKIKSRLGKYTWDLALLDYSADILNKPLNELRPNVVKNPYKSKWFADPFILDVDDEYIILLVEEFDKNVGRGRIAEVKIDKAINKILDCTIILDLPTHLSFPAIYRVDGEIYVHPENYHSGKSVIYRYDTSAKRLIPHKTLLEEPIADAVIHKFDGAYYMFATVAPDFNGSELCVYKSDEFDGEYKRCFTLEFESNIARMAGGFISIGHDLYRPAQNCNGDYGRGIVIQKVSLKESFEINDVNEWAMLNCRYAGLHTLNMYNGICVIDFKKYDYPLLYKLTRIMCVR